MLGRKDFTADEIAGARKAVADQLDAFGALGKAGAKVETTYFTTAVLAFDRRFVHRLRMVTGKDGTPLNELELIVESLLNNGGVLRGNNVIKYDADRSATGLALGASIAITRAQFEALVNGCLAELEQKF